jgi:2-phosphosulfolactate phosphatase
VTDEETLAHGQSSYDVRLDWGPTGAAAISQGAQVAVVVDVLSFTTTLCVATEFGVRVYPNRWNDGTAEEYAAERDATLAVGRSEGSGVSLSPASVLAQIARSSISRLVLPSPNGSAICFDLAASGLTVAGACLRNRSAVAGWLSRRLTAGAKVAVVAAGERWPDGSLRPAVEDLWGAGAVLAALVDLGVRGLSPEAEQAAAAFVAVEPDLGVRLADSASGRELHAMGFGDDVRVAGELDAGGVLPLMYGDYFAAR